MNIIAAISKNRVIAKDSKIPWYLPEDLKLFKAITQKHLVLMGRKTFESLGNKPLENRENIVLSKNIKSTSGVTVLNDFQQSLQKLQATQDKEKFIIGGGEIYTLFLPHVKKIYLSVVQAEFEGDVFFPKFESNFKLEKEERNNSDKLPFVFQTWVRTA